MQGAGKLDLKSERSKHVNRGLVRSDNRNPIALQFGKVNTRGTVKIINCSLTVDLVNC